MVGVGSLRAYLRERGYPVDTMTELDQVHALHRIVRSTTDPAQRDSLIARAKRERWLSQLSSATLLKLIEEVDREQQG